MSAMIAPATTTYQRILFHATYYQRTARGETALHGWTFKDEGGGWMFYGDAGAMERLSPAEATANLQQHGAVQEAAEQRRLDDLVEETMSTTRPTVYARRAA